MQDGTEVEVEPKEYVEALKEEVRLMFYISYR